MDAYNETYIQRAKRAKEYISPYFSEWHEHLLRTTTELAGRHPDLIDAYKMGYANQNIQPIVTSYCNHLIRAVPPRSTEIYPRKKTITIYAEYLTQLTNGMYNPEPLRTISDVFHHNEDRFNLDIAELEEALIKGADIAILAIYLTDRIGGTYRRRKRTDAIPKKLVADFNGNGGMELVEALYDGVAVEDIIGSIN